MTKVVYKQPLEIGLGQRVLIELGAVPVFVGEQEGRPTVWYTCEKEALKRERVFHVIGTGWYIPEDNCFYLGSVVQQNGLFVWHVFVQSMDNG